MEIVKKRVIIIGGGYAGVSLIHKLKNYNNLEILLIDKSQQHLLQTHIHKYLSGYYTESDITFNHEKYCKQNGVEFICGEVISINYENNYIITRDNQLHNYDYVVVATGSISIFPRQIENIIEYTKDIKDINNLNYYRNKFLKILESNPLNKSLVVVGGGVSGLQIACEYAYTIQKKGFSKDNIQITIIEGMDTLLPGMDQFLINKAHERCKELDINVITKLFASKILEEKILLSNGAEVRYDMLIFVIGAIGNSILNIDRKIEQNQKNQIIVDEYYRVSPYKNAFAIGDIVQANDVKSKLYQAPTAQGARMQAEFIADNIINEIKDKPLIKNNISNKGILIDLGGPNCAVGRLFNFNISGKLALWFKKLIYSLHSKKFN